MRKLFVIGLMSTGTSSLVGLLNSHKNIFVMYEVDLKNNFISKYGKQILRSLPESRPFFNEFRYKNTSYEINRKTLKLKIRDVKTKKLKNTRECSQVNEVEFKEIINKIKRDGKKFQINKFA